MSSSSSEEEHARFNQTMARLHVREQKLAADLNQLDKDMQEFRRDLVSFHARRAYVHALMQQEAEEELQYRLREDAVNTSTQMIAAPGGGMQHVASEYVDQDARTVSPAIAPGTVPDTGPGTAPGTVLDQNANPVIDDGDSLFIPEQARSNEEHMNALTSRPKRRVTFADDADMIINGNTSPNSMPQSSDTQPVTAPKSPF